MCKFIRALSRKAEKGNGHEILVYRTKDFMLFVGDTVGLTNKQEAKVTALAYGRTPDRPGVYARISRVALIGVAKPNTVWVPVNSIEKVICSGTAATAMNVGETTKLEPLPDNDVAAPVWHGHRRMKRGCCCLFLLLVVLNLFAVAYIAKKVEFLSQLFSPNSELRYMPGGTHPFCSDLCVNLCDDNDESTTITCEISDCMDACSNYFMLSANEDSDDADMALSVSMTNDDSDASNNEYESGHGGSHGGRSSSSSSEDGGHHPPSGNNGGPDHRIGAHKRPQRVY